MKLTEKEKEQILKSWAEAMSKIIERMSIEMWELEEENKTLKDKIEHLEFDIEAWKKLKAVWEKKEQKLQIEIWWLMWERDGLQMVVERLKGELDECECSFWFDSDEVWYRKREYKRLKKRIKDHCKWYWNLIPYSKGLDWKNARKSAEVFVGEIIENKIKENWKLIARLKQEERKNKSVRANRDYWKDKAEKTIKENLYLKDHIKNLELELNILKM